MTNILCKFLAESNGDRILKIDQHLAKLSTNNDSQCITKSVVVRYC